MTSAGEFVRANPGLEAAMRTSEPFARVRQGAVLELDDERLYIVRGDTLGDEAELFVETVVRGAQASDPSDPTREVYLELDDGLRALVRQRIEGATARPEGGTP